MKYRELFIKKARYQERLGLILRTYCNAHDSCKGCKFDHSNAWCFEDDTATTLPPDKLETAMKEIS